MTFKEDKRFYVYEWFVKDTGEVFYVGKGTKYRYKTRKRENAFFMKMANSHDCEPRIIKNNLTEQEAFEFEKRTISYYRKHTNFRLSNVLDGGEQPPKMCGDTSPTKRPEVRAKISSANKAYIEAHPEIHRIRSEKMKKFLQTEAGKEFIIKSKFGKTDEVKARMYENMRKTTHSEEFKQKHSKLMSEIYNREEIKSRYVGSKNINARKVSQFDADGVFIREFDTITEAGNAIGISMKSISKCLCGTMKTAGGFLWKYSDGLPTKPLPKPKNTRYNPTNKRPIIQYDKDGNLVKEFDSISDAMKEYGYSRNCNIVLNLQGKTKTAYGYIWRYK